MLSIWVNTAKVANENHQQGQGLSYMIIENLAAFVPNSAGSMRARRALALQGAQQIFRLLSCLAFATTTRATNPIPIADIFPGASRDGAAAELAHLFKTYGSDKSSDHDYHLLYAPLLAPQRQERLRLLEIGVGTNNTDIVSTMGVNGKPGASLRAFRDFLPNAQISGADIDRRILFSEDRIETYFVDQTRQKSFDDLAFALGPDKFDLVIDDGLHCPNANLATLIFSLQCLKTGGTLIIEDISSDAIPVWQTISALLAEQSSPTIIQAKHGFLFKMTMT